MKIRPTINFNIEHDVPMPGSWNDQIGTELDDTFVLMDFGDSFLLEDVKRSYLTHVYTAARKCNSVARVRTIKQLPGGNYVYRVWKADLTTARTRRSFKRSI